MLPPVKELFGRPVVALIGRARAGTVRQRQTLSVDVFLMLVAAPEDDFAGVLQLLADAIYWTNSKTLGLNHKHIQMYELKTWIRKNWDLLLRSSG